MHTFFGSVKDRTASSPRKSMALLIQSSQLICDE